MAQIVQLKNDNDTAIYPVTTGEAIRMAGGMTLDAAFSEAKVQILKDISDKKNELAAEVDAKKNEFNQLYTDKSGLLSSDFTTKTNELQTDYDGKVSGLQTTLEEKQGVLQSDYETHSGNLKSSYDTYSKDITDKRNEALNAIGSGVALKVQNLGSIYQSNYEVNLTVGEQVLFMAEISQGYSIITPTDSTRGYYVFGAADTTTNDTGIVACGRRYGRQVLARCDSGFLRVALFVMRYQ